MRTSHYRNSGPLFLLLALAACATPPATDARNAVAFPVRWHHETTKAATRASRIDADWWKVFANAELDRLIRMAEEQSPDIAIAIAAERQAEAVARIAGAGRWPGLDLELGGARNGGNNTSERRWHSANLAASYELDLWGRQKALRDSAQAGLQLSRFDHDSIRLGLAANVANLWLGALALREQMDIAATDLELLERSLALTEARQRAGSADQLDVARQRGLQAERQRSLAALRQEYTNTCLALGTLLGRTERIEPQPASLSELTLPAIDAGLPSQLLTRRPDLARAEAELAAADADVAAARAAMLPRINLGASALAGGQQLLDIFSNPAYSLFAALARPIFDGGRLSATRDLAVARRESLLQAYRSAVIAAFADTQNALNATVGTDAQLEAQREVVRQAEIAWQRAEARYRAGALGMIELIDSQRNLYAARNQLLADRLGRYRAAIALFRALGGGWSEAMPGESRS